MLHGASPDEAASARGPIVMQYDPSEVFYRAIFFNPAFIFNANTNPEVHREYWRKSLNLL
jgi:hypothetical protein